MEREIVREAVIVIGAFIRNVQLLRAIQQFQVGPKQQFWRMIAGNALDMASADWCKLFGSDHKKNQRLHWANVVPNPEGFGDLLLIALQKSSEEWKSYQRSVRTYRDTAVAHHDLDLRSKNYTYPDFTIALEAAYFYHEQLMKLSGGQEDARAYAEQYFAEWSILAKTALTATSGVYEKL